MAIIYYIDGTIKFAKPSNDTVFSFEEAQTIVGGFIDLIQLPNDYIMIVNDGGEEENLLVNLQATYIIKVQAIEEDEILGNVLVCHKSEFCREWS